jgi:hypothetical protein
MTESVELPNAIVSGMAVNSGRATGSDGEEHAIVFVSFEFHVSEGHTAQQTFIIHSLDSTQLRDMLKNPKPIQAEEAQ